MARRARKKPSNRKTAAPRARRLKAPVPRRTAAKPAGIGLEQGPANFVPLSPVTFLANAAETFPTKPAIIHGDRVVTYAQFFARARRLASALKKRGIRKGDTVAIMSPNQPAMLEAHFGVPAAGAILNPLNYRLDAATIAFCLEHGEAKLLLTDGEFADVVSQALKRVKRRIAVIDIDDPLYPEGKRIGEATYEELLAEGDPDFAWAPPRDEWQSICLLYTSGTTGNPKGVVYHHRGAYLASMGSTLNFGLRPASVYLWTLPMFHCNGWTFTWAATAAQATHVCLRRMDPALVFDAIERHRVTHLCGAPIVLNMLVHAPDEVKRKLPTRPKVATGGAAPPAIVIERMEAMGFVVLHLYGTTESYGPSTYCAHKAEWDDGMPIEQRYQLMARQGVPNPLIEDMMVANPDTVAALPKDGQSIGEIMLKGNTLMKGYLKNEAATDEAFAGGYYHSGDLAVWHGDSYIEVKDRSKDIIISGGENISSLEVEEVLYRHPEIMEAAVVARPDEKWGETPCAFVTLKPGAKPTTAADVIAFCRTNMAGYKIPKTIVFGPLPKTSTGKIQKFVLRDQAKAM